ncbi:MAG: hypothetical protein M3321_06105 [Actinomycetota bacterium]|nr:hypothetical protein [Actinomycetota bacterium]
MLALIVVAVATVGLFVASREGGETARHVGAPLRPLPEGEPALLPGSALDERVDTEKMLSRAEIVFIGTVTDIGASEVVTRAGAEHEPFLLTRHRVRLTVERALRGTGADVMDVSLLDLPEANYEFEVGKRYFIFARRTELGTTRTPAVIPDGYAQGVFALGAGGTASNPINGTVRLDDVAERLR